MGSPAYSLTSFLTPDEYLALEEKASFRSEYLGGHMYAMSGSSFAHARINVNVFWCLENGLRSGNCQALSTDMKVWIESAESFVYPDAQVLCGEPRFYRNRVDTVENPSVVIEILSDSTEKYDRGHKFQAYQTIPELRHFVLISQDQPLIEVYTRDEGRWIFLSYRTLAESADLAAIGVQLPLSEIYHRVEFPIAEVSRPVTE